LDAFYLGNNYGPEREWGENDPFAPSVWAQVRWFCSLKFTYYGFWIYIYYGFSVCLV